MLILALACQGQSTLGVILGTVRDASGRVVNGANIRLTNAGENTSRESTTDENGEYGFQNTKPGVYTLKITQPGFKEFTVTELALEARQIVRADGVLEVGSVTEMVEVRAEAGVIATDSPAIASYLDPSKVTYLPGNLRAGGSTSPYSLIVTVPGVQTDNGNAFSIQGGLPAQSESSVDGVSITNVTGNSPNRNLFPSVESIAEIKVQGVGNTAEFGAPGDISAVSKSGTNAYHGALFWYHQNRAMDARSFGQTTLPAKVGNTFGGTMGGPIRKDRTFLLFTAESLRFPREETLRNTVPTQAMREGRFVQEGIEVRDPSTGQPFPQNLIPVSRINAAALAVLPYYPLPNQGDGSRVSTGNYVNNRRSNIRSNQWDLRLDHQLGSNHAIFGRYTTKHQTSRALNNLLLPADESYADYRQGVVSYTWTIRPNLLNELRGGISYAPSGSRFPFDGLSFFNSLNFKDVQRDIFFNALPVFNITNLTGFGKSRPNREASWNIQVFDNLTWVRGRHTFKLGADLRFLRAESTLGFIAGDNYGNYNFSGNFTGSPWGDFLLGAPRDTAFALLSSDNDGRAAHVKAYAQDSVRVLPNLTVDIGVRWEFHPGYHDAGLNIANFDRSVPRSGRVILPSDPAALGLVAPAALSAVNACPSADLNGAPCTPFVAANAVGLPEGLRKNYFGQFLPRLGIAYRWNDKTTIRTGFGIYNMILLGSTFFSLTGTVQSDVRSFNNVGADGRPVFYLPETRTPGSGVRAGNPGTFEFRTANQIDFRPPYMMQWSLSIDRQLEANTGLRLSYVGNRSVQLPWAPDLNQLQPSTNFYSQRPLTDRPFPNWGLIYSRDGGANSIYNEFQSELNHRYGRGITASVSYTLAKHLADNAGPTPTSFAGENGGGRLSNSLNRRADRGNVYATRRHRAVATVVYDLPLPKTNPFIGGWSLASIVILQSGPWLTPTFSGGDPSGTGATRHGSQRPDRIAAGNVEDPTASHWLDRSAFLCPGRTPGSLQFNCSVGVVPGRDPAPIARFGNSGVGILEGPGTAVWNLGLSKRFTVRESISVRLEGTFTNILNRTNLGDPILDITNVDFGRITGARGSDFGGGRTGQVSLRLEF